MSDRCQNCHTVEQFSGDGWTAVAIYDSLGTAEAHARRLARGRVVPADCDEMASCTRHTPADRPEQYNRGGPGGVIRFSRSGEPVYVSRFAAQDRRGHSAPYAVERLGDAGKWTTVSRGDSLAAALEPLGGRDWWIKASPDEYRVRAPGGVVIAPLGRSREQQPGHPVRPQPAGPRVRAEFPVPLPVPVRQSRSTPSEVSPMNPQKFYLSRHGKVVRTFDDRGEAERAVVHFRRHDPHGSYRVGMVPTRYARGTGQEPDDNPTGTGIKDLGSKKSERFTIEMQDDDGQWVRVADSYPSHGEAQQELREIAREEKFDGELRVRRLSDDEPDTVDDDDQGNDIDPDNPSYFAGKTGDPKLGQGGSYPDPRSPGRGGEDDGDLPLGKPMPGGPRNPREVHTLVKYARQHNIADMATAWSRMSRGY